MASNIFLISGPSLPTNNLILECKSVKTSSPTAFSKSALLSRACKRGKPFWNCSLVDRVNSRDSVKAFPNISSHSPNWGVGILILNLSDMLEDQFVFVSVLKNVDQQEFDSRIFSLVDEVTVEKTGFMFN
jgi:hypothetical protein